LATSHLPQGPFIDIGFIAGLEGGQDPALFVDDDHTPYLYWGAGGVCHAAQLTNDLRALVPSTIVDLTPQLANVYEGPWVHKYHGKYYLSYPGLPKGQWPEIMYYAIANHPLGPYAFQGCYIPEFPGRAGTNHGSIVEFKNRWLALHHSAWVSGGLSEVRNLMADYLEYNPDGTIKPISPTTTGVAAPGTATGPSRVTVLLEAENGAAACGELRETRVAASHPGFSGSGYVEGFGSPGNSVSVMVQAAHDQVARLKIRYRAQGGLEQHKVRLNQALLADPVHGYRTWEKLIDFPGAQEWAELDLGTIQLKEGDNTLMLYSGAHGTSSLAVDCFILALTP
jgi:hypothetical protein